MMLPLRREPDQIGKPARGQPRKPAAFAEPPDGQAPIAVDAVPPQAGRLQALAAHRLHRIAEDRLDVPDLNGHRFHGWSMRESRASRLTVSN